MLALSTTACSTSAKEQVTIAEKDHVQIPNPFVNCDTLEEAEALTGFKVVLPAEALDGYTTEVITVMDNRMIQVVLSQGENEIVFRKAVGNEDISGDYNEYDAYSTVEIGTLEVHTKGNDGLVNTVSWHDDSYAYSITANIGEVGLEANIMNEMIASFQ